MKIRGLLPLLLAVTLLFSGCGRFMSGSFMSVTPHAESYDQTDQGETEAASSYEELTALLRQLGGCEPI